MHMNESWKWLVRLVIGICLLAFLVIGYITATFEHIPSNLTLVNKLLYIGYTSNEAFYSFPFWFPFCFAIIGAISLLIPKHNKAVVIFLIILLFLVYKGPQILNGIGHIAAQFTKSPENFQLIMLDNDKFSEPQKYFLNNNGIVMYKYVFVNPEEFSGNYDEAYLQLEKNAYDLKADGIVIVKGATRDLQVRGSNPPRLAKYVYGIPFLKKIQDGKSATYKPGARRGIGIWAILGSLVLLGLAHFLCSKPSGYIMSAIGVIIIGALTTFAGIIISVFVYAYRKAPSYESATTTWQLLISLCIPLVGMGIIAFGGWLLRKSNNSNNNGL